MLILTRKETESIIINGNITVTVLGVNRGQIRLGITAPVDISIHREEIQRKIDSWKNGVKGDKNG